MDEMQMLREYHDARPGPSHEVVAEARARLEEKSRTRRHRTRRRRYVLGAAAAGIAAVVTVPVSMIGGGEPGGDPAYAAERLTDGRIKVTMHDLTGPAEAVQRRLDGIESELAALGVEAEIELIPFGTRCSTSRGEMDRATNSRTNAVDDGWDIPDRDKRAIFYVHPERIKPGNTLVWTLAVRHDNGPAVVGFSSYQVRGPAKPCNPVPLLPPRPQRSP